MDYIPKHITAAYVDAVLLGLNHLVGDAERSTKAARMVTAAAVRDMYGAFSPEEAVRQIEGLDQAVKAGLSDLRPIPGDPKTIVVRLISASPTCIFASVKSDFSQTVYTPPKPPVVEYAGLRRSKALNAKSGDPTPWMFFYIYQYFSPHKAANQCG